MADSSWEFLKTQKVQLKTVQNNCYRQNYSEATNFGVEVMSSKAQVKGNCSRGTNSRLPFTVNVNLSVISRSALVSRASRSTGAPNEDIVQNH